MVIRHTIYSTLSSFVLLFVQVQMMKRKKLYSNDYYYYKKKMLIVEFYVAASAVLSHLERREVIYQPTTVAGGSWQHTRMLLMPTITKPIFKKKKSFQPSLYQSSMHTRTANKRIKFIESYFLDGFLADRRWMGRNSGERKLFQK